MNINQEHREEVIAINEKITALFTEAEVLCDRIATLRNEVLEDEESGTDDTEASDALYDAFNECDYAYRAIKDVETALKPVLIVPVALIEISGDDTESDEDED